MKISIIKIVIIGFSILNPAVDLNQLSGCLSAVIFLQPSLSYSDLLIPETFCVNMYRIYKYTCIYTKVSNYREDGHPRYMLVHRCIHILHMSVPIATIYILVILSRTLHFICIRIPFNLSVFPYRLSPSTDK
jgi:hypothetical protein